MDIGNISKRYAKALLLFAQENNAEDVVYKEMHTARNSFMQVGNLRKALENPVLEREQKFQLMCEAAGGKVSSIYTRFVHLVLKEKREGCFLFMVHSYIDLYRKLKKIYIGELITALPVEQEAEDRMRSMIEKATSGTVEFNAKVDASIKGGFILQMDSYRLDASVEGQLRSVLRQFKEKNSITAVKV